MDFLNRQMNQAKPQPVPFWMQTTGLRYGFISGLLVGIFLGWFFHGVVWTAIRLGALILLLVPIVIIMWLWFRFRGGGSRNQTPQSNAPNVITFGNLGDLFNQSGSPASRPKEPAQVIDLDPADYDLETLKKRMERDS
jgi:hypothetical protein